jgi:hypothetical protein
MPIQPPPVHLLGPLVEQRPPPPSGLPCLPSLLADVLSCRSGHQLLTCRSHPRSLHA